MDYLALVLNILSIIIPVWATVYTVNKRIKAQTHENHQPHLVLENIIKVDSINKYKYYLTLFGRNFRDLNKSFNPEEVVENKKDDLLNVDICLKNIGYGVATNIKFYDLLKGEQVYGRQETSYEQNQRLFTTFDIGVNEIKKVSAQIVSTVINEEEIREDHNRILCVYKDLNDFVDSFIITINVKSDKHYDYFAYQPSSASYKKWIKQNKKQYNKIMEKYTNM